MSGGFFRGTSADQDTRFSNKQQKLLKSQKFAPELEHLVDMTRVKMDVIKPWIATRVTELLGFEDEVLINFIYSLLDGKEVNGKEVQISLTGFMEKNTVKFMKELWMLLLSAQKNESGVPQQFLDAKEEELRKRKEEMDRITNEIQKKKEKENRELECERSKKMDGGVETKEPVPKHMLPEASPEDARGAENRNGRRDRSSGSSPQNSKSASNSRSYSGQRSRSLSSSPEARGRSISPHGPRKRSITPRRKHSPRMSRSPPGRSSYGRRRSRSLSRRVSLSPVRRRVRSPYRRRSPSPFRRRRSPSPFRRRRSPSPIRGRRSPVRRRSPLHRRRLRSPFRRRYRRSPSTPSHGSPALVRRSSPHPTQRRSPAPVHDRSHSPDGSTSPSVDHHRPLLGRSPQDNRRLAPTSRHWSPTPYGSHSPSPIQKRSSSPVRRGSSRERRTSPPLPSHRRSPSPYQSSSPSPAQRMSLSSMRRSSKEHRRSPTPPVQSPRGIRRGHEDQKDLWDRKPALSPFLERSPIGRNRSPREDIRSSSPFDSPLRQRRAPIAHDGCLSPPQKQSLHSFSTDKQKDSPKKAHSKDQYSPEAGHRSTESRSRLRNADLRNKGLDRKRENSSEQGANPETQDGTKSSMSYKETVLRERQQTSYERDGKKTDERSSSHLSNFKDGDARCESETSPVLTRKVDHYNGSSMHDSGSEESDKHRTENKVKRKHRRSHRHEETSGDDSSDDSENEDRKEAKRRRKEEKRLRKEEKRRRRKERRHKKEEKRAEKLKLRNRNDIGSDEDEGRRESHTTDNEDTQSEQKKLEIELRNKALESLKAKKGMNN